MKKVIIGAITGLLTLAGLSYGRSCPPQSPAEQTLQEVASPVQAVLDELQKRVAELKSYEGKVDYVVSQPLLESEARRTGVLYYGRFDERSYLRIDFLTLQQDEEPQQDYREQFVFDGVWLQHISYQTQSVERRQIAEPNEPVDAFALASRHVPVFGFAKVEDLHKQFEIELVPQEANEPPDSHHLHLKVKPDSIYKDDYSTIDFWIDKRLGLPVRILAVGSEGDAGDIYEIKLLEPKINAGMDKSIFQVEIPREFSVETIPLEKQQKQE
jgi:outer membrane lipoprotein-sorting protein